MERASNVSMRLLGEDSDPDGGSIFREEGGKEPEKPVQRLPRGYAQVESSSCRELQVVLHFNLYLSVIFIVLESVLLANKLQTYELDVFGQVLAPLCFGVWAAAELIRLYFGYSGNLQEKLPQIAVFFLLSIFPQLPCLVYVMHLQSLQLPMESVLGWSVFILTLVELGLSYGAVRKLVVKQTSSYARLVDIDEEEEEEEQRRRMRVRPLPATKTVAAAPADDDLGHDDSEDSKPLLD